MLLRGRVTGVNNKRLLSEQLLDIEFSILNFLSINEVSELEHFESKYVFYCPQDHAFLKPVITSGSCSPPPLNYFYDI